jgi:hypothetical protein
MNEPPAAVPGRVPELRKGRFTRSLGAGLAAAAVGGALWAALASSTEREFGFAIVVIGPAVALAMRRASGGLRGTRLQLAAIGCSLLGVLLGKFLFVAHAMRALTENAPDRPPDFHLSYLDPRMFKFFVRIFPHMLTFYDGLWLLITLSGAWFILRPARTASP